jgi:hypothetical protein
MGFEFMENQTTYKWFGRWVGDTPLPDGMKQEDLGRCTHAIRVPDAVYEIGVLQTGSKYQLLWDYWDGGGLEKQIGKNAGKLKQAYTLERIRKESRLKGYMVSQSRSSNGIRMVLTLKGG